MKHHRKTVGKHCQKKNGMRKTMKGGVWPFTSYTPVTTSDTTSVTTTPVATTPAKPFSYYDYLPSLPSFLSSSKTAETSPPLSQIDTNANNNTGTGGYMGGKRKGKTAKKPCPKKGGGK